LNRIDPPTFAPRYFLKKNLLAEVQSYSDVGADHLPHSNEETIKMKLALIGAAAIAAAAFATPALAQAVVADPGYCFYYSANCLNLGPGNSYADGGYYRDPQNANAVMSHQVAESDAHRYHGGPKYND
jgi:hypothetical protein